MKKLLFIMILSLICVSCATGPTRNQILDADYGERPKNVKNILTQYLSENLVDPYSVRDFKILTIGEGYDTRNGLTTYGYWVLYEFNAKNRFGGYTGKNEHCSFIRNGKVLENFDEVVCKYAVKWK